MPELDQTTELDLTDIIQSLEGQAQNLRERVRSFDAERARLAAEAEKLERAAAILRDGSSGVEGRIEARATLSATLGAPPKSRPTREAVRDVLYEHPGEVLSAQELLRAAELRGWIDPTLGAPIEAVRYGAKTLVKSDPAHFQQIDSSFRWVRDPEDEAAFIERTTERIRADHDQRQGIERELSGL